MPAAPIKCSSFSVRAYIVKNISNFLLNSWWLSPSFHPTATSPRTRSWRLLQSHPGSGTSSLSSASSSIIYTLSSKEDEKYSMFPDCPPPPRQTNIFRVELYTNFLQVHIYPRNMPYQIHKQSISHSYLELFVKRRFWRLAKHLPSLADQGIKAHFILHQ